MYDYLNKKYSDPDYLLKVKIKFKESYLLF